MSSDIDKCVWQFDSLSSDMVLRESLSSLKYKLSEASLTLLPEYKERLRVLYHLQYIDNTDTVQLKVSNYYSTTCRCLFFLVCCSIVSHLCNQRFVYHRTVKPTSSCY